MKLHGTKILLFWICLLTILVSASAAGTGGGECYECYAQDFREAVLSRNSERIRELIGNANVSQAENMRYAVGSEEQVGGEAFSLFNFFSRNSVAILVDSIRSSKYSGAYIYYVKQERLKTPDQPGVSQIDGLEIQSDFVACEISLLDGRIFMPHHLCFYETDIFETGLRSEKVTVTEKR